MSIRKSIPHVKDLKIDEFLEFTRDGYIDLSNITEKTDGFVFQIGYDQMGFYTQSSSSSYFKMRTPMDYFNRHIERNGHGNFKVAAAFAQIHAILEENLPLLALLKGEVEKSNQEVMLKGEMFYKPLGSQHYQSAYLNFNAIPYNTDLMGSAGLFVLHENLYENQWMSAYFLKHAASDPHISFDGDRILFNAKRHVTPAVLELVPGLDLDLLRSRKKPSNKAAKEEEIAKFDKIKSMVSDDLDIIFHSRMIRPKWGQYTEGHVIHPSSVRPDAPRVKVTSLEFRDYRERLKTNGNDQSSLEW